MNKPDTAIRPSHQRVYAFVSRMLLALRHGSARCLVTFCHLDRRRDRATLDHTDPSDAGAPASCRIGREGGIILS